MFLGHWPASLLWGQCLASIYAQTMHSVGNFFLDGGVCFRMFHDGVEYVKGILGCQVGSERKCADGFQCKL